MGFRYLVIGDIVGRPGRRAVRELLPGLKERFKLDLVVANAENAAGGSGLTLKTLRSLESAGVQAITLGDHVWKRREIVPVLDSHPRIVRPANYPRNAAGRGAVVFEHAGVRVGLVNLIGRVFMNPVDCPFREVDRLLQDWQAKPDVIIVDMHAEATSEKQAMGWHLDGRVTSVHGTHTHVQTADERILPRGTAYITDLGMTGPHESIIGRCVEPVLHRFTTGMPAPFEVARADIRLSGAVVEADPGTGRAVSIVRVHERVEESTDSGADDAADDDGT